MTFSQVTDILNAVTGVADIVGLAITEFMPWGDIALAKALRRRPLLG